MPLSNLVGWCSDRRRFHNASCAAPRYMGSCRLAWVPSRSRKRFILRNSALNDLARFFEGEARGARVQLARVAVSEVAQEIGFHLRACEEHGVHHGVVEARHRS